MYSKQNEIESIVEDLIENTIIEVIADSLSSKRECELALEILQNKLEEFDISVFEDYFDK